MDSSANLCSVTEHAAALSRKARQGSAEMSGCYRNSPTDASTEKYRMVKERRGGCQSRNGRKMNGSEGEGDRGGSGPVRGGVS